MFEGFRMEVWGWLRNPWLELIFQTFCNTWDLGMRQDLILTLFKFLSRCVQRWLLGWIFRNFSWNFCSWCCGKPLEKDFSPEKRIAGTSWDIKGISGNPELPFLLFVPKKNVDFDYLKVQKIPLSFIIEGIYFQFQAKIPRLKLLLSFFVFQEFGN